MTSAPVRDRLGGHLLRPGNAALLLTGYRRTTVDEQRRGAER